VAGLSDLRHPDPVIQRLIDYLRSYRPIGGRGSATYDGTGQSSPFTVIRHGLGAIPRTVQLTSADGAANNVWEVSSVNDKTFSVRATTRDESTPAAGTVRDFYWLAVG
jgi:hypothetical protein